MITIVLPWWLAIPVAIVLFLIVAVVALFSSIIISELFMDRKEQKEIVKWKTAGYPKIYEQYGCYRLSYKGIFCERHRKIKFKTPKFIEVNLDGKE